MNTSKRLCQTAKSFLSLKKKAAMYNILAQINKIISRSFTKQGLAISKAKKWQMAIIGCRYFVAARALG